MLKIGLFRASTIASTVLFLALGLAPGAALAGDAATGTPDVTGLNQEGTRLFKARDYRRAAEKFMEAYSVGHDPNLLFNIARCYESLGDLEAAIEKYEMFLEAPGAEPDGKQRAQDRIAELRAEQEEKDKESKPAAAQKGAASSQPTSAATPAADAQSGPSLLPWITLGSGAAFAGAGTVLYLMGAADHAKVSDSEGYGDLSTVSSMTESEARDLADSGDTKKLMGGIGLGVGGALMAAGIGMLLAAPDGDSAPAEVGLVVNGGAAGSTLLVKGSF